MLGGILSDGKNAVTLNYVIIKYIGKVGDIKTNIWIDKKNPITNTVLLLPSKKIRVSDFIEFKVLWKTLQFS